jgi:acyl carrier protein
LRALPLTTSGTIDHGALLAFAARREPEAREGIAPEAFCPEESLIVDAWSRVVRRPITRSDTFRALGGDSLALAEALAILRQTHGIALPPRLAWESSVADLGAWILGRPGASGAPVEAPEIVPLEAVDPEAALALACETFATREPLCVALSVLAEDMMGFARPVFDLARLGETSFVARDRASGALVGFAVAMDIRRMPELLEIPAPLAPAMELLDDLTGEYLASGPPIHDGEVIELVMTGAAPFLDGYGVAAALEARVLEASRAAGFRRAMTICTHRATALLAQQMGFSRLLSRPYAMWQHAGRAVFASMAAVHGEAAVHERSLIGRPDAQTARSRGR